MTVHAHWLPLYSIELPNPDNPNPATSPVQRLRTHLPCARGGGIPSALPSFVVRPVGIACSHATAPLQEKGAVHHVTVLVEGSWASQSQSVTLAGLTHPSLWLPVSRSLGHLQRPGRQLHPTYDTAHATVMSKPLTPWNTAPAMVRV